MEHIKLDLINEITTEKYYLEHELARLYDNENISYKEKINKTNNTLAKISDCNHKLKLVDVYFSDEKEVNPKNDNEQ